jgi:hypothetical protein
LSELAAALERGRRAARSSKKWEPVGVDWHGRLIARVRNTQTGAVDGVIRQAGQWTFYALGRTSDGKVVAHVVRDSTLKRIAKAMIGENGEYPDLIRERHQASRERTLEVAGRAGTSRGRRRRAPEEGVAEE